MVQKREDSGLSVKAFCKQAGIAPKTYYYRLRRLREAAIKCAQSKDILLPTAQAPRSSDQMRTVRNFTTDNISAGAGTIHSADRIYRRSDVAKHCHQNIIHDRRDPGKHKSGSYCGSSIFFEAVMIDLSSIKNYYIACGYTDLRRGIDGLAQIVTLQYGYEINENSLFLFCGRRTDRIKALWFSGDGFVLLYKRLNNGHFQWPRSKDEMKLLSPQSFRWLMEGLSVEQKRVIKKVRNKDMF